MLLCLEVVRGMDFGFKEKQLVEKNGKARGTASW